MVVENNTKHGHGCVLTVPTKVLHHCCLATDAAQLELMLMILNSLDLPAVLALARCGKYLYYLVRQWYNFRSILLNSFRDGGSRIDVRVLGNLHIILNPTVTLESNHRRRPELRLRPDIPLPSQDPSHVHLILRIDALRYPI
jgi:hypothetical protein